MSGASAASAQRAGAGTLPLFAPLDPAWQADPYTPAGALRMLDPVHKSPLGMWVLTRHADCLALLKDRRGSSDARKAPAMGAAPFGRDNLDVVTQFEGFTPFLFLDPPDHTRLRGLVSKAFTPRVVEGLRPRIGEIVDGLLDRAVAKGTFDVIEDLAYPLPVQIISELLGVPPEDEERFKGWSGALARGLDPEFVLPPDVIERRNLAGLSFVVYFQELIARRRAEPGDDLLSKLIGIEEEGDVLSEAELLATCILLLVAGHETTVNLIGNGALALCRHPDAFGRLRDEPALVRSAVEEVLRYDPPVQLTGRLLLEDYPVGDVTIPGGEFAVVLIASANRDPEEFPFPETFDVAREPNHHLGFGFGIHHCLGAPLARLEGQVALGALAARVERLELASSTLTYKENMVLRGLERLDVAVH